ncbi:MAG: hypothetical protein AB8B69_06110 [Chitinophagales bacterium]
MPEFLIEILKYVIPSLIVFLTAYFILSKLLEDGLKRQELERRIEQRSQALPLRLQAYERLALYLERISPHHLLSRNQGDFATAPEQQIVLISSVRMEFEHNITQQLYVSRKVWGLVKVTTEETITIINRVASSLPSDASGRDLIRAIFEYVIESETSPTDDALEVLNAEAKQLLV